MTTCQKQTLYEKCLLVDTKTDIKTMERLAKECNVPTYGWVNKLLHRKQRRKKYICMRLLTNLPTTIDYIPVASQLHSFITKVLQKKVILID